LDEIFRQLHLMLPGVQNRTNLAAEMPSLHGSKRDTAALTATHQHIAPMPRKGCATPGCIRPQPALDPATGRRFRAALKHFGPWKKDDARIPRFLTATDT
jgi:hypothetical protein